MPSLPVSQLADAAALSDTDLAYLVQTVGVGGVKAALSLFKEYVQDAVAALCVPGTNMSIVYNDTANTLTFSSTGGGGGGSTTNYFPGGWF